MDTRHARQSGVESEQQVEALLGPHLPDDDARRSHPQGLLHQIPKHDFAGALEPRLPGLHRDPVGMSTLQFEDFFTRHQPLTARYGGRQAIQHGRLAGLRTTGHHDIQARDHGCVKEIGRLHTDGTKFDKVFQ